MKERIISAIVAFLIFIPIFIVGGKVFNIAFYVLTLIALREFMNARETEKKFPDFIRLISYILISFLYFVNTYEAGMNFSIDYRIVSGLSLSLLLPVILYHNERIYNVRDAFYLLGGVFFLGFAMSLFYMYRVNSLSLIIFLFLITITTDSFAYFTGRLIGKTKLLEAISPNKTWEGTIGGSVMGTFICTVYYLTVIDPNAPTFSIILIILLLSVVGQLGDLFFSSIKRRFKIKDFSNLMPGHGGVLDRLDSIIFVMLTFTFFLNIL